MNSPDTEAQGQGALQYHCVGPDENAGALQKYVQGGGIPDTIEVSGKRTILNKRICRVQYQLGLASHFGTGFLIGPRWIMTNYHVVGKLCHKREREIWERGLSRADAWKRVEICFDVDGVHTRGTIRKLAEEKPLLYASKHHQLDENHHEFDQQAWPDSHFDVAILQLESAIGDEEIPYLSGQKRGWISLIDDTRCLLGGITEIPRDIFILQHAAGRNAAIATGLLKTINGNRSRLRYNANTTGGSSGSPCFLNIDLKLIALHHAGDPRCLEAEPQVSSALLPDHVPKPHPEYNQGIPITKIVAHLARSPKRRHLVSHGAAPFTALGDGQNTAYLLLQRELNSPGGIEHAIQKLDAELARPLVRLREKHPRVEGWNLPPQDRNAAIYEVVVLSGRLMLTHRMVESLVALANPPAAAVVPVAAGTPGRVLYAPPSDPCALFMTEDRKAFISRPGLIEFARDMWSTTSSRSLLVEGEEKTGRSFLHHYFRGLQLHFEASKVRRFKFCHFNLRELATQKRPDARNVGIAIEKGLDVEDSYCSTTAETDTVKFVPFAISLRNNIVKAKTRNLVFIDGFDKIDCTPETYLMISHLIEKAESEPYAIRYVLVGFDRSRLGEKGRERAESVKTGQFTEGEVTAFLERVSQYVGELRPDDENEINPVETARDILLSARTQQSGNLISNTAEICTTLCRDVFKI